MQAQKPPSIPQSGPTSSSPQPSASDRAVQIQQALKGIVLQTAYALRSRAQLVKLNASLATAAPRGIAATNAADESATSLEPLGAECAQYLALVRGLRDYLLHAQAALEIEVEAATKREASQAEQAAATLKQQQAVDTASAGSQTAGEATRSMDVDPAASSSSVQPQADSPKRNSGTVAGEAIVIDDDKDEDDVPLSRAGAEPSTKDKPVDLTDSPDLPLLAASSNTQATSDTVPVSQPGLASTNTGLGLNVDLSALGMNLENLSSLSSFDLPTSSQSGDASALASTDNNYGDLGKMMGIDLSSLGGSTGMDDFSSFANLQSDSLGNTLSTSMGGNSSGNDMDFFSGGDNGGGLDLSSFDFSSLGGEGDFGGNANNNGGVDLSAFLNTFGTADDNSNNTG